MRKLTILFTAAMVLLLTACDISSLPMTAAPGQRAPHWKRSGSQAYIFVQIDPSAELLRPYVQQAVRDWSVAKRVELIIKPCPSGAHCVGVYGAPRNGGITTLGWGAGSHFTQVSITFDNSAGQAAANLDNGICHEFGHVLGLAHPTPPASGPCRNGAPTAWDLLLVDSIHDHTDA